MGGGQMAPRPVDRRYDPRRYDHRRYAHRRSHHRRFDPLPHVYRCFVHTRYAPRRSPHLRPYTSSVSLP